MKKEDLKLLLAIAQETKQRGELTEDLANELSKHFDGKKNRNFAMAFQKPLLALLISGRVSSPACRVLFIAVAKLQYGGGIGCEREFRELCGYKDRTYFRKLLRMLEEVGAIFKRVWGRENLWFISPAYAKKGNKVSNKVMIEADDPEATEEEIQDLQERADEILDSESLSPMPLRTIIKHGRKNRQQAFGGALHARI